MRNSIWIRCLPLVALLVFIPTRTHAAVIRDGDLIKTAVHDNVYIVKIVGSKKFKRLILNPDIFNQYSHLHWSDIKTVTEAEFGLYTVSYLVREIDEQAVFRLFPDGDVGIKRWVDITPSQFDAAGYDWDSVYIMNAHERDAYPTGAALSSVTLPKSSFLYGIVPGISTTADIDKIEGLGVNLVRVVPSDLSFTKKDLQSRGINIMVLLVDPRGSSPGVRPPADYDAWVADIAKLVRANRDVKYWEVWNEPNEILFWYPTPNAAAYVTLLKKAYVAIKAANPDAVVISAGLSGINPPRQYLRDMYATGAAGWFDILALHPYHQPNSPDTFLADYLKFMKNIMESYGDLETPIWITELGWPTDPAQFGAVSVDQQGQFLTRTFQIARSLPYVGAVIWYRLQEAGQGFGIVGKPAEAAYRLLTH